MHCFGHQVLCKVQVYVFRNSSGSLRSSLQRLKVCMAVFFFLVLGFITEDRVRGKNFFFYIYSNPGFAALSVCGGGGV